MRKKRTLRFNAIVLLATFLAQLFVAVTPFVPLTAGVWRASSPQDFYNALAVFTGVQLLLLTTGVTLILLKASQDQNDSFADMQSALPLTIVKKLTGTAFYNHFRSAVEDADHSVRIAYLAPYPPADVPYRNRNKYYQEILELMKKRTEISFRRLIRGSEKNKLWVADLLQELRGRPNVDISWLTKDLPENIEMPLAMSVQVVDGNKTWMVALGEHETKQDYRDIYIENADVTKGMSDYVDRIWSVSEKLLDRGRLTTEGEKLLEEANDSRE